MEGSRRRVQVATTALDVAAVAEVVGATAPATMVGRLRTLSRPSLTHCTWPNTSRRQTTMETDFADGAGRDQKSLDLM